MRVGETRRVSVDVRIISATNKNLEQEVISSKFRKTSSTASTCPSHCPPEESGGYSPFGHFSWRSTPRSWGKRPLHLLLRLDTLMTLPISRETCGSWRTSSNGAWRSRVPTSSCRKPGPRRAQKEGFPRGCLPCSSPPPVWTWKKRSINWKRRSSSRPCS